MMIAGGILKFAVALIGLSVTLLILILGLVKKDNSKIKRAVVIFAWTWVLLLLIGAIEFFKVI
jgi:hypothetical protein